MGFLSIVVANSMQSCLFIAITEMVVPVIDRSSGKKSFVCEVLHLPLNHAQYNGSGASIVSQYQWPIHEVLCTQIFFIHFSE